MFASIRKQSVLFSVEKRSCFVMQIALSLFEVWEGRALLCQSFGSFGCVFPAAHDLNFRKRPQYPLLLEILVARGSSGWASTIAFTGVYRHACLPRPVNWAPCAFFWDVLQGLKV